jgi:TrmH family RNA methyltransferase
VAEGRPADLPEARVWSVSERVLRALAETETPQGVVAVAELPPPPSGALPPGLVLVLDGLADPGNLGTALRSAAAFGATACLVGPGSVDPWNGKALRAAAGATFRLRPRPVADLAEACASLLAAGFALYGLVPRGGLPLPEAELPLRTALVVGNEARGLSDAVRERCQPLTIPMPGGLESLNAGVAAAVAAYAWSVARWRRPS